jgi:hypothetical protein
MFSQLTGYSIVIFGYIVLFGKAINLSLLSLIITVHVENDIIISLDYITSNLCLLVYHMVYHLEHHLQ